MYPKQETAFFYPRDAMGAPARYSWIEAGTKTGKTVGGIAWLFEEAYQGRRDENFWWVAPTNTQAAIAFRRMRAGLPSSLIVDTHENKRIELVGGRYIWFKSGENPDSLYGEDVHAVVMDEASRARAEAWYAVRSTLTATRGPFRAIGNVKGRKNWFFQACRRAEGGSPNMSYHRIIAADAVVAGVLTAEDVEDARRVLPDHVFRELYLAEPTEDGSNPFGMEHIRRCYGPMSGKDPVAWGWDLAKSTDWTVGIALDDDGALCRFHRFQMPWQETTSRIKSETGIIVPALVDSTGVGDPILENLQRASGNFEGLKFSPQSKQKIMEGLAVAIQSCAIHFPPAAVNPPYGDPAHLANELEQFEFMATRTGVRYSAPEGVHDDTVCAAALAEECKRTRGDLSTWIKLGTQ